MAEEAGNGLGEESMEKEQGSQEADGGKEAEALVWPLCFLMWGKNRN